MGSKRLSPICASTTDLGRSRESNRVPLAPASSTQPQAAFCQTSPQDWSPPNILQPSPKRETHNNPFPFASNCASLRRYTCIHSFHPANSPIIVFLFPFSYLDKVGGGVDRDRVSALNRRIAAKTGSRVRHWRCWEWKSTLADRWIAPFDSLATAARGGYTFQLPSSWLLTLRP